MTPARAASPEPSAKVASTTRSKSMPMTRAVSASCATARTARPRRVRVMMKCTATIAARPPARSSALSRRSEKEPSASEHQEHVTVGELDHVEHAEEQREPDRHHGVYHAQHHAVGDVLAEDARVHSEAATCQAGRS